VTWAEFVEAGLLRSYRRDLGVRMAELRAFIDRLRSDLGVSYPLADRRPYVSNKDLVMRAQEDTGLHPDLWLMTDVRGQLMLLRQLGGAHCQPGLFQRRSSAAVSTRPVRSSLSRTSFTVPGGFFQLSATRWMAP
jgi:hypothetical protein